MPIHDWTRVDAGLFHAFHHDWITNLSRALNAGVLPPDYFALPEQSIRGPVPDVLTLTLSPGLAEPNGTARGLAVATVPPRARLVGEPKTRSMCARQIGSLSGIDMARLSPWSR